MRWEVGERWRWCKNESFRKYRVCKAWETGKHYKSPVYKSIGSGGNGTMWMQERWVRSCWSLGDMQRHLSFVMWAMVTYGNMLWLLPNIFFCGGGGDVAVVVEGLHYSVLSFHCSTILLNDNVYYSWSLLFPSSSSSISKIPLFNKTSEELVRVFLLWQWGKIIKFLCPTSAWKNHCKAFWELNHRAIVDREDGREKTRFGCSRTTSLDYPQSLDLCYVAAQNRCPKSIIHTSVRT